MTLKCHFCYLHDQNGPKGIKIHTKLYETEFNTEMIFIYFEPHSKLLKNGHL